MIRRGSHPVTVNTPGVLLITANMMRYGSGMTEYISPVRLLTEHIEVDRESSRAVLVTRHAAVVPAVSPGDALHGQTVQYSTVQYSTVQYSTVQYSTCTVRLLTTPRLEFASAMEILQHRAVTWVCGGGTVAVAAALFPVLKLCAG